jgi:3-oxoacyl-[acyl-carrier protein] reductase
MNLTGRSAIVTGASQGLGRAISEHFLRAGASVLLVARDEQLLLRTTRELVPLATQPGQQALAFAGDVSRPESCSDIASVAIRRLDKLCILVNNAGVYGPMGRLEDINWESWVQAIQINLLGTVLMCRAVLPHFRSLNYGKIINLSGGGATAPLPRISAYAASKAAIVRLTETLALETTEAHIDVNAVAPGALNTRLLDEVLAAGPDRVGKDFYDKSLRQRDEGGAGLEKGAELATFLASSESDGISGRLLSAIWDDWAHLPEWRDELACGDVFTLRRITPGDRGRGRKCA